MAGRVNKQFVITLSLGLGGVFVAVALVGLFFLKNSASDLAKRGDDRMQASQFDKAQEFYAKAVNKEQTNAIYLKKWRESLQKLNPENLVVYRDLFENWTAATRQLARVQKDDIAAQREYLELVRGRQGNDFSRAEQEGMITQSDALIVLHKSKAPGGEWETLKRYRGQAKFEIFNWVKDAKAEVAKEAEADLLAAIAADPSDTETVLTLEAFYLTSASRAFDRSQLDAAKELEEKSLALVKEYAAKNPKDGLIQLQVLRREIALRQREFGKTRTAQTDINAWIKQLRSDLKGQLEAAMAGIRTSDSSKLTPRLIDMLRNVELMLDDSGKLPFTSEAITLGLTKRPQDAQMMGAMADVMMSRNDIAAAGEQLQKILDLPIPPISLDGLRLFSIRNNARFLQTLWAGRLAASSPEADRPRLLATAKALREKLAVVEAPDSPQVQLVDGQIAFVEGDYGKANQLLDKHYKATRQRPNGDALFLQAQVAEKVNQLGLAKERLDECVRVQPTNVQAIYMLADVEARLQNTDRALALYRTLAEMSPDNATLRERVAMLSKIAGNATESEKISDPVVADLIELRSFFTVKEGAADRTPEAIAFLKRRVVERKQDPRLATQLAALLAGMGNRDEALTVVKASQAANPDNTDLKDFEISLTNTDPVEARLKILDSREAPAIDKFLARYQILREAGRIPEAEAQLAEAYKLDPKDMRVTEFRFLDAISKPDWELAQALTDEAVRNNLDDANGQTYRARLLGAQRKFDEALAAITEAVGKGGALPEVWRIKGRIESQVGKPAEAVASYRQALRLRPTDVSIINDLVSSLVDAGQAEEALKLAKESEKYSAGNERFISNWLTLEAQVGSKRFAIERRESIAKSSPKDRENLLQLAALYIGDRDWVKSRPMIDRARELEDGTDVLSLDAAWHWEQGEREKARTIFQTYINRFDKDKITSYPFMIYAQFLASHDDEAGAVAVLEQARAHQDPKIAEADKAIVEVYMKQANIEQAAAVSRRVISAQADTPEQLFRMRLVECLVKLKDFAAADTELKAMGTNIESDATTMMLAAEIKAGINDTRGQKDLLDRAVTRFPTNALVFMKRGQSLAGDMRTAREAISDFNKAIQLNPNMWQAYRLRGAAHLILGQKDPEAYNDLSSAALLAPYNDELVYGLVSDFIRDNKMERATELATQIIAKRDRDIRAMTTFGSLFASASAFPEASRYYKQAFELERSNDAVVQRYLDCLLSSVPPNTAEASQVLTSLGNPRIQANPGFLMAVAKLSMKLGRLNEANAAASDALKLLQVNDPTMMLAWFNDLRRILDKPDDMIKYLDQTARLASAAKAQEWLGYFKISTNLERKETSQQALPAARELLTKSTEPSIRQLLFRSISGTLFAAADYPEAFKVMREGLGEFPDDVELLNNGAFCLADKLDRAGDAVPMIEKAVTLTPAVADLWDTYGLVFYKTQQYDKAAMGYQRALYLSSTTRQVVNCSIHLMDALLMANKKEEAKAVARDLQSTMDDPKNAEGILEDMRARFTEVKKRLDSAK